MVLTEDDLYAITWKTSFGGTLFGADSSDKHAPCESTHNANQTGNQVTQISVQPTPRLGGPQNFALSNEFEDADPKPPRDITVEPENNTTSEPENENIHNESYDLTQTQANLTNSDNKK